MTGPPLVGARDLSWSFHGRRVLGPLSLAVEAGEFLVLIGPNGAGKTTCLRLLAGLLEPEGGERLFGGVAYSQLSRRQLARRIAYVPQVRPARIPLSVEQVVLQGRYPHLDPWRPTPDAADFAAVERALARVGLEDLRRRRVDRLSGGERQAVFLAAALAQEAQVLILDEPTTHLDPRHQAEVSRLLLDLKREAGATVIAATHELRFAELLADRLCALRRGAVLREGPPDELLRPEALEELFETPFEAAAGLVVPRVARTP